MIKRFYLDYNASTPLHPKSWEAMQSLLSAQNHAYNASAIHSFGREGQKIIENARKDISNLIGADKNQIIFNSGATEGNNTILRHFSTQYPNDTILISAIEHPSILEARNTLPNIKIIPVDDNGLIIIEELERLLKENTVCLVSIMAANNENGAIQDVSEMSKITNANNALYHCDATQAAGKISINMKELDIDFLTISSHKIGGPQGVGALALGICGQSPSLLFGGGQEKSLRAGTENVAGIAGFGAAARSALNNIEEYQKLKKLRDDFESKLKDISPDIIIHSQGAKRIANTSFFSLPNADSQTLLMALDLEGIAVSNGSACSSGRVKPSHVLEAMGKDKKLTSSALRISMGWATKGEDIEAFLEAWQKIYTRMSNKN